MTTTRPPLQQFMRQLVRQTSAAPSRDGQKQGDGLVFVTFCHDNAGSSSMMAARARQAESDRRWESGSRCRRNASPPRAPQRPPQAEPLRAVVVAKSEKGTAKLLQDSASPATEHTSSQITNAAPAPPSCHVRTILATTTSAQRRSKDHDVLGYPDCFTTASPQVCPGDKSKESPTASSPLALVDLIEPLSRIGGSGDNDPFDRCKLIRGAKIAEILTSPVESCAATGEEVDDKEASLQTDPAAAACSTNGKTGGRPLPRMITPPTLASTASSLIRTLSSSSISPTMTARMA